MFVLAGKIPDEMRRNVADQKAIVEAFANFRRNLKGYALLMARMIRDHTRRFAQRLYYREKELDGECERLVCTMLEQRFGQVSIFDQN